MSEVIFYAGLVLIVVPLTLVLKKETPAIALLLALAAGGVLLFHCMGAAGETVRQLRSILSQASLGEEYYLPVVKVVGVAVLTRIVGAVCRDGGQSALAAALETAGVLLALFFAMPLLQKVLALAANLTW